MKIQFLIYILVGTLLVHCTAGKNKTNVELIQDMMKQSSIKAQEKQGSLGMRLPPEGTQPMGSSYYPYKDDVEAAIRHLKNPIQGQSSQQILLIGKRNYQKACVYCHGDRGDGEGMMKNSMVVRPPSLLSKKVRQMPDGHIYHIIHEGQGMMGSHRLQVRTEKERWALVNYIRNLQKMAAIQ